MSLDILVLAEYLQHSEDVALTTRNRYFFASDESNSSIDMSKAITTDGTNTTNMNISSTRGW